MPACFNLIDKVTGELVKLSDVDDKMRIHFGADPNPHTYYNYWYSYIGFKLACGTTFDTMLADPDMAEEDKEIVLWLKANYKANSWYER